MFEFHAAIWDWYELEEKGVTKFELVFFRRTPELSAQMLCERSIITTLISNN